jgi:tRNA-dihydrouridine synthase
MLEPAKVAECVAVMRAAVSIPVTVKMRVGVITAKGRAAFPQKTTARSHPYATT